MKRNELNNGQQPSAPIRVGIYLRVSTRRQVEDGQLLQEQKEEATRYAEQLLGPVTRMGSVVYYADLGRSGMDDDRLELNRLLADVRAGHLDLVLASSANRISRTWIGQALFEEVLDEHQVRLRFVEDCPPTAHAGSY